MKTASHYIVFNVAWNATLHILLWLVLTFYCWECTKILSLTKLIYCFPIAIALWLINFILPFLFGKNLSEEFWHLLCQLKTMEMMYQKIGHQLKHILPNCDFMCIFLQKIKYQNAIYINNVFH